METVFIIGMLYLAYRGVLLLGELVIYLITIFVKTVIFIPKAFIKLCKFLADDDLV